MVKRSHGAVALSLIVLMPPAFVSAHLFAVRMAALLGTLLVQKFLPDSFLAVQASLLASVIAMKLVASSPAAFQWQGVPT
jgi:hypothetical protein